MPMTLNLVTLALAAALGQNAAEPHYTLTARIEPDSHRIAVRGQLTGWSCATGHLYLNRDFRLDRLRVGGRDVRATIDTAGAPPMWVAVARPITLECPTGGAADTGTVQFEYTGEIADTISRVNLIAPRLVELALYSGWFPRDPTRGFTYELELDLPRGWVVAGGGPAVVVRTDDGRETVRIVSATPGGDIAFVAAPDLVTERVGSAGASVEVLAAAGDRALAVGAKDGLARTLALYRKWFGEPGASTAAGSAVRFVYSPRGGWGYSRLPLVVVSGSFARERSRVPLGAAWNLLGNAHEMAHFWWRIADTNTTDDWINEGLAEFSAWAAVATFFGREARDSVAARYRADVASARTDTPIALTPTDSPDRYVNRYEKAALVFAALEARVGPERLHAFLATFHAAHRAHGNARTDELLESARRSLGEEPAALLERCVLGSWKGCEAR